MIPVQAIIVGFTKPFFTYNKEKNLFKALPTDVAIGSTAFTSMAVEVDNPINNDSYFEADTIEEVLAEFDRLGFAMPEEDVWDFLERSIRVSVKDNSLLSMLKAYPELISFLDTLKDFIVSRNGEQLIYLNELYDQHRQLFQSFGANIESNASC